MLCFRNHHRFKDPSARFLSVAKSQPSVSLLLPHLAAPWTLLRLAHSSSPPRSTNTTHNNQTIRLFPQQQTVEPRETAPKPPKALTITIIAGPRRRFANTSAQAQLPIPSWCAWIFPTHFARLFAVRLLSVLTSAHGSQKFKWTRTLIALCSSSLCRISMAKYAHHTSTIAAAQKCAPSPEPNRIHTETEHRTSSERMKAIVDVAVVVGLFRWASR